MTSFFISDIHLSESNNKLSSAFINFLKDSKESCSQLFILGDLFEVWIGDDYETSFINDIKSELLKFTTNGPDTFLMHCNRDFLISEKFLTDTGIKLLPDPFEVTMNNKSSGTGPIQNEANNGLPNDRGTIAMARTMDPHSATSQFFINHKDNGFLNHTGETSQGWGYAVFGKVTEGMEVVDKIADVPTGSSGAYQDVPEEVITIESVTISE